MMPRLCLYGGTVAFSLCFYAWLLVGLDAYCMALAAVFAVVGAIGDWLHRGLD